MKISRFALASMAAVFVTAMGSIAFAQEDAFERHLVFPQGTKYAGEPLDLSVTRSLIELSDQQILSYGLETSPNDIRRDRFVYAANFRHMKRYWVAKIPKNGARRAIFQFQNLSSLARKGIPAPVLEWLRMGHIQMRFQMRADSPIELRTQVPEPGQQRQTAKIFDYSYALNAVRSVHRRGQGFDPLGDGMHSGYGLSQTFISTPDSMDFFRAANLNVEQYPMTLTPAQASSMLRFYLDRSIHSIETEIYNTIAESCVTSTMKGIYSAVPNKHVIWWGRFWRNWRWLNGGTTFENNPRAVVALLEKQGYIRTGDRMPNLEVEAKARRSQTEELLTCSAIFG